MTDPEDQLILLIDKDDVVRDSLKVLLESYGMPVEEFRGASEFMMTGAKARTGCLVLGFNRHIVDGLELVATLRRQGFRLPVIFMVGGGDDSTRAAALAAGATAYLERPIEEMALIRAIKAALAPPGNRQTDTESDLAASPAARLSARP